MGNHVTTLGQIYPIEYFLADFGHEIVLDSSLGSTRFMKVAKVRHRDAGMCVAKVYALNDASIPSINANRPKVEFIKNLVLKSGSLSALPYTYFLNNERCIILLRQYVKYNLYDRLSTRPFLTSIEKRWIAYQILRSIQFLHSKSICHGDIKSENILATSYLWITLADFASHKPVTLPENNPSDFSYFFDTSRRHSCNMAPERFVECNIRYQDSSTVTTPSPSISSMTPNAEQETNVKDAPQTNTIDTPIINNDPIANTFNDLNQLTPQMDLFSVGCVLAELFAEDIANGCLFDLGQLLMYKKNQYNPSKLIADNIPDIRIQNLIKNLINLDPMKRDSVSQHLENLQPSTLFPAYFSFLYEYVQKLIPLTSDAKIFHINHDLNKIVDCITKEDEHGLLVPLIIVTSSMRSLQTVEAKLTAIKLCVKVVKSSSKAMAEFTLDRVLPYIVQMISKSESQVRAICVSSLNTIMKYIDKLPPSDSNIFVDYILPALQPLVTDQSVLVRIALASNLGDLAQTSKNFLDQSDKSYDAKLNGLQDGFKTIITQLLTDDNNSVKCALLQVNDISKLCDFFGKEKTNEVILHYINPYINDKSDFRLRISFFRSISHIAKYLGQYYAHAFKSCLQQGISDSEEFVIHESLCAISEMTRQGLMGKEIVYELFSYAVPLLSFPNKWIRYATVNLVTILSKFAYSLDFNRRILPNIKLHLKRDIHGLRHESILLDSLQTPLPRLVIESTLINNDNIDDIFEIITHRKALRNKSRYRHISETDAQTYDEMLDLNEQQDRYQLPSKNEQEILTNVDCISEDRLLDSEILLRRMNQNKRASKVKTIESVYSIKSDIIAYTNHPSLHQQQRIQTTNSTISNNYNNSSSSINNVRINSNSNNLQNAAGNQSSNNSPLDYNVHRYRGILLAHLHEHEKCVNQVLPIRNSNHFITCSDDTTMKLWDSSSIGTSPQILSRSKQTIYAPDASAINNIAICPDTDTLLSLTANNNLHIYKLNSSLPGIPQLITTLDFDNDVSNPERVVNVISLSQFNYVTCSTKSNIKGYDLRIPQTTHLWQMSLTQKDGLITCMDGNDLCLACGTSSGTISLFDLRFYIKATSMRYPVYNNRLRKRVRSIYLCDDEIYCSVDGNNEVSVWNCESGSRTKTLWASQAPCLTSDNSWEHSVFSMIVDPSKRSNSIITAGSDMKIRFWDLNNPHKSYIISKPPPNPHLKLPSLKQSNYTRKVVDNNDDQNSHSTTTSSSTSSQQTIYRTKLVDSIQVIQEYDPDKHITTKNKIAQQENMQDDILNTYHRDSISCLATLSNLLVSASRDGIVKIWR